MEGNKNERELYREIIRRANRSRDRAAETLRRARACKGEDRDTAAANRRRRPRKKD